MLFDSPLHMTTTNDCDFRLGPSSPPLPLPAPSFCVFLQRGVENLRISRWFWTCGSGCVCLFFLTRGGKCVRREIFLLTLPSTQTCNRSPSSRLVFGPRREGRGAGGGTGTGTRSVSLAMGVASGKKSSFRRGCDFILASWLVS